MSQSTIDLIVSWAPFVVLIAVFLLYGRRIGIRARGPSGHTLIELYELQLAETKRTAAALERIAQALEKR